MTEALNIGKLSLQVFYREAKVKSEKTIERCCGILKKADWRIFRELTEEKMQMKNFNFCSHPSQIFSKINKTILTCAKRTVSRGKVKTYKCFWSTDLKEGKAKRDRLKRIAKLSKNHKK
ncbi:hypothetical protein NPIL_426051 [Nephila pilipes]|uniref:Uncharacterized protein n=1 Tax=Nephila pilipes TaxID=299642 RepID=A0A8X6P8B0_NEPPI|nr:hypothetical protein NPIL_426051 [Nephila pilipes]